MELSNMKDRRDDVGMKVTSSIFIGIVMLLVTLFINSAWLIANEGKNKAFEIGERVAAIEVKFISIQDDLTEIKQLLKRKVSSQ